MRRTEYCGLLTERHVGREATVMGWVRNKRDMGGVLFIDLRDREGTVQVVFDARNLSEADFAAAEGIRLESVIAVQGTIRIRDDETYNPRLATGTIELAARSIEVLSEAEPLPLPLTDSENVREELRLKYRYLDLRRPRMIENLRLRANVQRAASDYLESRGFLNVETPILTKSTPEGARDYLVPSRLNPGSFYALPQSPQIFKQLLMVGGIDRYYQIARCFRDEDLRADRQPEFTQVDIEMSFIEQEDILALLEELFKAIVLAATGKAIGEPFPRITWMEAMDRYGSDKPDLRFGLPIVDVTELLKESGFSVFRKAVESGGVVRAINVKAADQRHGDAFTRAEIDALTEKAVSLGAGGMAWIAMRPDGSPYSILTKFMGEGELNALLKALNAEAGDFILFCADRLDRARKVLGGLRTYIADRLALRDKADLRFLIVTDFPQFEYSAEERRYQAMHHPFTMPFPDDLPYLFTDPARVRAQAYDVVLNGVELGSGSIRIHRRDIQQNMFEALGFSPEEIETRFGFMVNAFRYGTPPHGGFAFGLDRFVMLLAGAGSIREVTAFPKNSEGRCPMTDAPGPVDDGQILALGLTERKADGAEAKRAQGGASAFDIDHIASLAKIRIEDDERDVLAGQMARIVEFAGRLSALNTDGVPPTERMVANANVFRADGAARSVDRETILDCAPEVKNGYVFVPQVVE